MWWGAVNKIFCSIRYVNTNSFIKTNKQNLITNLSFFSQDEPMDQDIHNNFRLNFNFNVEERKKNQLAQEMRRQQIRKNSISLLEPEATSLASFMDLTQQDYEVNAPVSSTLLQGQELLRALEINTAIQLENVLEQVPSQADVREFEIFIPLIVVTRDSAIIKNVKVVLNTLDVH